MTILQPQKNKATKRFLALLFGFLVLGGAVYIFEYGTFANYRHELQVLRNERDSLQAENTDLRSQLYAYLDPAILERIAQEHNLILDRTPEYLVASR